jgi:AcrR family transcriptional regulator
MNEELYSILKKVKCLYQKYGIKSVTMDDVSHELGISKKTLYQYVQDKDELVQQVVDLELEERKKEIQGIESNHLNAIEETFEINRCVNITLKSHSSATEYDLKKYYPALYVKIREVKRAEMQSLLKKNLLKGIKEGLYREDIDIEIITKLHLTQIDNLSENEIISIDEYLNPKFFNEVYKYHLRGLVTEKGLKILDDCLKKIRNVSP